MSEPRGSGCLCSGFVLGEQDQGLESARPRLSPATSSAWTLLVKVLSSKCCRLSCTNAWSLVVMESHGSLLSSVSVLSASTASDRKSADLWRHRNPHGYWPLTDAKPCGKLWESKHLTAHLHVIYLWGGGSLFCCCCFGLVVIVIFFGGGGQVSCSLR